MIYLAAAAALALVGGLLVAGSALLQRRRARPTPPAPVARVQHPDGDPDGDPDAPVLVARGLPPVPPPGRHRRHDTGDELTMTGFMRVLDARTVAAETRLAEAVTAEHATTR